MPTLAALDDAMLRPGRSVPAINRLGGGTIALARDGQPWRVVGSTAVVYQLRQARGRLVALRCPLAEPPDPALAAHYRALAQGPFAPAARQNAPVPLVERVAYVPEGLSLPAPDFRSLTRPAIALDWVSGETLSAAVDRAASANDGATLAAIATFWLDACTLLNAHGISHGNLTGDNAMVPPDGQIVLVDYDGLAWPGGPRPPQEPAAPDYRHPSGATASALARRDDFAALVIYASLRLLALRPDLRTTHGDRLSKRDGALLFGARDLENPDGSPLFRTLRDLAGAEPEALVEAMHQACRASVNSVPMLPDLVATLPALGSVGRRAPERRPAEPAAPVPSTRERQEQLTRLNALLLAGDEPAALRFWHESGLSGDADAVREIGPRIESLGRRPPRVAERPPREAARAAEDQTAMLPSVTEAMVEVPVRAAPPVDVTARRRAKTIERLQTALEAGDMATVATLWSEVRDDPRAVHLSIRMMDVLADNFGLEMRRAMERQDDAAMVAIVRDAEKVGVAVPSPARRAARRATDRLEARRNLAAALSADDRRSLASLALRGRLDDLGPLEPTANRNVARALEWPYLERALATDDDTAIVAAYDPGLFGDADALTVTQRERVELAHARVEWLAEVRSALRNRNLAVLRGAVANAPDGAAERLSDVEHARIERLTTRGAAVDRLANALRDGPDEAIIEALNDVATAGATLPEALDWAAVRGIVDRMTLADAIRQAATADPPDYGRLARLLPVARAAAADGDPRLGPDLDLARLERDVLRAAHVARLRDALFQGDDAAIAAAADPDPYNVLTTFDPEQRARVNRALAARRAR